MDKITWGRNGLLIALFLFVWTSVTGCSTKPLDEMSASEIFADSKVAALSRAAETGDVKQIEALVKSGVDVNARGRGNVTPLLRSYDSKNFEGFDCLLKHGADPNILDETGAAVVLVASMDEDPRFLRRALESGGNPNLVNIGNRHSPNSTPIFYAIGMSRVENARLLIDAGANVHHRNGHGALPLTDAMGGNFEIAIMLIEAGADIHAKDQFGKDSLVSIEYWNHWIESEAGRKSYNKLIDLLNAKGENLQHYKD